MTEASSTIRPRVPVTLSVSISGTKTTVAAHGYRTATPGILITNFVLPSSQFSREYALTHEQSGRFIGGPYPLLNDARAVAGALGGLGDWTADWTEVEEKILATVRGCDVDAWFMSVRRR